MAAVPTIPIDPAEPAAEQATGRRPAGLVRGASRLWRTRIGLLIVLALVLVAILGPYLAPHGPTDFVGAPAQGRGGDMLFGGDMLGQDVWSRFLNGGRSVLLFATLSTVIGVVTGVTVGLLAAYSRGVLDDVLMRTMDVILAFPQIMLALVAVTTVGAEGWVIVLAVGLTTTPRVARVIRGAAVPVVERDFVASAEALGEPRLRILLGEVLPNVTGPLLVEAALRLTYSVGVIAALAFLGVTPNPNSPDWGYMINENATMLTVQPWGVVLPVLAIALLTIGSGLVGDGLARTASGVDRRRGE